MIIELRCDAARPRAWIAAAAASIASEHSEVFVNWVDTGKPPPAGLDGLFRLEHLLLHRERTSGAAILERQQMAQFSPPKGDADVIIDFTDVPRAAACNARSYLRPLYNGLAGEDAALTAALTGDLPVIDIVDEIDGRIVDRGHPSSEVAVGLSGCLETIMARTTTLLNANLLGNESGSVEHSALQQPGRHRLGTILCLCGSGARNPEANLSFMLLRAAMACRLALYR